MDYRKLKDGKFCEVFEKRARKYARVNRLFRKGDKIKIDGAVSKFLITKILGKFPIEIKKSGKVDKVFSDQSLDDEVCYFLDRWLKGKVMKKENRVSILRIFSDEDIMRFAKFHKLKFKVAKKNKDVFKLVESMRSKYPGSDLTLLGNIDKLYRLTDKK